MTKDSKSGWANFNASQLSNVELFHTDSQSFEGQQIYIHEPSQQMWKLRYSTPEYVCRCIQFVKSSSLSQLKSEDTSEIVNKLTKSKKTAESIPEPKPGPLPAYAWLYQYSTHSPMNPMNPMIDLLNTVVWGAFLCHWQFHTSHSKDYWLHDKLLCSSGK